MQLCLTLEHLDLTRVVQLCLHFNPSALVPEEPALLRCNARQVRPDCHSLMTSGSYEARGEALKGGPPPRCRTPSILQGVKSVLKEWAFDDTPPAPLPAQAACCAETGNSVAVSTLLLYWMRTPSLQ